MDSKFTLTNLIRIGLLMLLIAWCFLIIKPFLAIVIWAIILGVAMFPLYDKFVDQFGEKRKKLGATLFALFVIAITVVPSYIIVGSIVESTAETVRSLQREEFHVPRPDESVRDWPLIGQRLYEDWSKLSDNLRGYALEHKDFLLEKGRGLVHSITGFVGAILATFVSLLIAIVLMYYSETGHSTANQLMKKLAGESGHEIVIMSRDTIRSVVKGILLVALIQAGLAFIGFKLIGLPAAGIFAFVVLLAAIVQIPALLVMIPAIILAFSIANTTPAILFTIYIVFVALSDNFLKPLLLGKGLQTPILVILIGTIGGMLLHGIIGLFIGAVVLAVAHRLYLQWVETPEVV